MSIPAGNGATGASGTGPALGYLLNLLWFNSLFMLISENNMNTCTYFIHTLSFIYIMKLILIFGIKIYRKLSRYLTHRPAGRGIDWSWQSGQQLHRGGCGFLVATQHSRSELKRREL